MMKPERDKVIRGSRQANNSKGGGTTRGRGLQGRRKNAQRGGTGEIVGGGCAKHSQNAEGSRVSPRARSRKPEPPGRRRKGGLYIGRWATLKQKGRYREGYSCGMEKRETVKKTNSPGRGDASKFAPSTGRREWLVKSGDFLRKRARQCQKAGQFGEDFHLKQPT